MLNLPSPDEALPPRSLKKSMRRTASRIVSVGAGGGGAPSTAKRRAFDANGGRQPGRRDAVMPAPTFAAFAWSSASSGRNSRSRASRASSAARSSGRSACARDGCPLRCARCSASAGAAGRTSSVWSPEGSEPAARAVRADAAGRIRRSASRVALRRRAFTRASESIAQGDLGDIREPGVLGLRDAAEIQRQPLPPESQSVRQSLELTERVVVIPHPARDLVRIFELDTAMELIERVGHQRLVEVAGREQPEAFLLVGLPREADLDVP